ncbi:MAG: gliding motility-associated ABC transporter ATP-binding subunit GldA [Bacteroidales bacterium]|nr:gliding motility-associated ABC transporter ATP-binding subunit GldA [Bacteroidales bacterium]
MSVQVEHITKIYGEQKALDDVSFEVKPGEVVGLLGPNGAGKSTLMKILTCFLPQTSGEASVMGFDVLEESVEVRKRVGYLPENNPLYLDMYLKEYLEFIAHVHKLGKNIWNRIAEIIELTGLGQEQNKKLGELSKGYRQRVGIAQALIHQPEVLILDEPTSGLDPNQLVEIRNLITKIGKEKTVILSTHIMQEVEAVCDRTIIIHKGRIIADDQTENLSRQSANRQVIIAEFDSPIDKNMLASIQGVIKTENTAGNTWRIEATTERDVRSDIFKAAVNENKTVLSLNKETRRLEDIFHQLTQNKEA